MAKTLTVQLMAKTIENNDLAAQNAELLRQIAALTAPQTTEAPVPPAPETLVADAPKYVRACNMCGGSGKRAVRGLIYECASCNGVGKQTADDIRRTAAYYELKARDMEQKRQATARNILAVAAIQRTQAQHAQA